MLVFDCNNKEEAGDYIGKTGIFTDFINSPNYKTLDELIRLDKECFKVGVLKDIALNDDINAFRLFAFNNWYNFFIPIEGIEPKEPCKSVPEEPQWIEGLDSKAFHLLGKTVETEAGIRGKLVAIRAEDEGVASCYMLKCREDSFVYVDKIRGCTEDIYTLDDIWGSFVCYNGPFGEFEDMLSSKIGLDVYPCPRDVKSNEEFLKLVNDPNWREDNEATLVSINYTGNRDWNYTVNENYTFTDIECSRIAFKKGKEDEQN